MPFSENAPVAVAASTEVEKLMYDKMTYDYKYCEGLSDEQIDRYREFAKIGSEKGSVYSTEVAMKAAENEYELFLLETRLWEEIGDINGASVLSKRYFEGILNTDGVRGEPNYKLSYAYMRAEKIIYDAGKNNHADHGHVFQVPSDSANHSHFDYFEEQEARYAGLISPQEEIEAEAQDGIKLGVCLLLIITSVNRLAVRGVILTRLKILTPSACQRTQTLEHNVNRCCMCP